MSNDLIPFNDNPIAPIQADENVLPPLNDRQSAMLNHIIAGASYVQAYLKAGYTSEFPDKAAWDVINKSPIKLYLGEYRKTIAQSITPDYVVNKLNQIADNATDINKPAQYNPDNAIKALDMVAKIGGYYAAQRVDLHTINATIEDIRNARAEYKQEK